MLLIQMCPVGPVLILYHTSTHISIAPKFAFSYLSPEFTLRNVTQFKGALYLWRVQIQIWLGSEYFANSLSSIESLLSSRISHKKTMVGRQTFWSAHSERRHRRDAVYELALTPKLNWDNASFDEIKCVPHVVGTFVINTRGQINIRWICCK